MDTYDARERRKKLRRQRKRRRRWKRIGLGIGLLLAILGVTRLVQYNLSADSGEGQLSLTQAETVETPVSGASAAEGENLSDAKKLSYIENSDAYPDSLKEMAEKNGETLDFVYDYPEKKDTQWDIDLTAESKSDTVPLLLQWDERWGYTQYSGDFLGYTGCGPTTLSMIVLYLTGDAQADPAAVAAYAEAAGYSVTGSGSSWTLISEGCEHYGVHASEVPLLEDKMQEKLDEGCPLVINVGPGDFTDSGHFLIITGYDWAGFTVNDPNSRANSELHWTFQRLQGQIRNIWAMYT